MKKKFKFGVIGAGFMATSIIKGALSSNIIDISDHAVIIELTGSAMKIEAFKEMMRPYNILEMSRTGMIAMTRSLADSKKVEADNHIL